MTDKKLAIIELILKKITALPQAALFTIGRNEIRLTRCAMTALLNSRFVALLLVSTRTLVCFSLKLSSTYSEFEAIDGLHYYKMQLLLLETISRANIRSGFGTMM